MADNNDILIKEVDEELQRERMQKLWEQYSGVILGAAAAILLGVGGFKFYEHQKQVAAEAAGSAYVSAVTALRDNKRDDATKAFEKAGDSQRGLATLAKLRLAAADYEAGKTAEALAAYESLATDRSADPMLSDFARLQTAMLTIDTASWTDMKNRLNPLMDDKNAWRHEAREVLGLTARKSGENAEARKLFEQLIGDNTTPQSISERAKMVMAILTEAELAKSLPILPAAPAGTEPTATPAAKAVQPGPAKKTK